MQALIESGGIVDLILVLVALELAALWILWWRRGLGVSPRSLVVNIAAGASLMLALRAALTGAGWQWVAAWLVASLVFHLADLAARWTRRAA